MDFANSLSILEIEAVTKLTVKIPIVKPVEVRITLVILDLIENKPIKIFLKKLFISCNFSVKNIYSSL